MRNNNQKNYENEITNLKNELYKSKKIIQQQKSLIDELKNKVYKLSNNSSIDNTNYYKTVISQKDIELNKLKSQLNKIIHKIPKNVNFDDIVCVNFISSDQNVHYAAKCLKTDIFAEIEESLYKQYPKYRETNNTFIANGAQILRFKTIEENKIGNGLPVTLIVPS